MVYSILIDSEFQNNLYEKLEQAQKRIYVQSMIFEGDTAGSTVAQKLIQAKKRGVEVKVSIDCWTDFYVSNMYYKHKEVAHEVQATKRMIQQMQDAGIELVRTRPYGPLCIFFLCRNHKKLIIIDNSCYIGGVNISDRSFAWHDFMVRFDDASLVDASVQDFTHTLSGKETNFRFQNCLITNKYIEKTFHHLIRNAKHEVIISSPYLIDAHLIKVLQSARRGVHIKILTPKQNNFNIINRISPYVYHRLKKMGVDIYLYTQFSHAKFMIVDRERVLFGSSNFGLESFLCREEIGIYIDDHVFAREFYIKLYNDKKNCLKQHLEHVGLVTYCSSLILSYILHVSLLAYAKLVRPFVHALKNTNCQ